MTNDELAGKIAIATYGADKESPHEIKRRIRMILDDNLAPTAVTLPCCSTCRFFLQYTTTLYIDGVVNHVERKQYCRRFPEAVTKSGDDWCGEWKEKT